MNTDALRKKILDLAIRGKLVPQDPNDEPASVLLERIRTEKQQMVKDGKLKKKDIKNDTVIYVGEDNLHYEKFQDGTVKCIEDEIPFELPEGWEWTRLASICIKVTDGTHHSPENYPTGEYKYITAKNVKSDGVLLDDITYVASDVHKEIFARCNPEFGDILYIKDGATSGIATVNTLREEFSMLSSVALLKPAQGIDNWYMCYAMQSPYFYATTRGDMKGVGITRITLNMLTSRLIPIAPKIEQQRISIKVRELICLVTNIESDKNNIIKVIANTKRKILDLAIRGELVPQNPDDEPASVLLERIRVEKEELIKQGKIKRDKKESVIFKGDDNSYYLRSESKAIEITNELPYEIPDSWEWARIGDVLQVNPRNKIEDLLEVSFIPMPLIDDGFSGKHTSEVRVWEKVKSGFTPFMEGDIGIAKITPCFENRKSVVFRNLKNGYGAGTTELHILRPYASTILPEYILAYVKSSMFIGKGKQEFTGAVGQQRIGKDYVENSCFPIPPFAEQTRIVEQIHIAYKQLDLISNALL